MSEPASEPDALLGEAEGDEPPPGRDVGKVGALLLLGPAEDDREGAEGVDRVGDADAAAGAGELLDDDAHVEDAGALAAVLLRHPDAHEVVLLQRLDHAPRVLAGAVELGGDRADELLGDLAGAGLVLLGPGRQQLLHDDLLERTDCSKGMHARPPNQACTPTRPTSLAHPPTRPGLKQERDPVLLLLSLLQGWVVGRVGKPGWLGGWASLVGWAGGQAWVEGRAGKPASTMSPCVCRFHGGFRLILLRTASRRCGRPDTRRRSTSRRRTRRRAASTCRRRCSRRSRTPRASSTVPTRAGCAGPGRRWPPSTPAPARPSTPTGSF